MTASLSFYVLVFVESEIEVEVIFLELVFTPTTLV